MFPARFSSRIVPPILHHGGFRLNGRLLGLNARGGLGPTCRATADGLFIGFRQSNRRGNAVLDKAGQHSAYGGVKWRVRLRPGSRRDASTENRLGGLPRSFVVVRVAVAARRENTDIQERWRCAVFAGVVARRRAHRR